MPWFPELAWRGDLLESDRRYFEAGAEIVPVPGAQIAVLRGYESLAAGFVVQRIEPSSLKSDAEAWVAGVEDRLRAMRAPRARLYVDQHGGANLDRALNNRGYRLRLERGMVRAAERDGDATEIELVAPEDGGGWSARREMLRGQTLGVDGHAMDPDLWVTMERLKHEAGYMRPYFMRSGRQVVGVVCAAVCGKLLRIKNLFVHPAHRRRGVATGTAIACARGGGRESLEAAGCFALDGEPGRLVYEKAGYRTCVIQEEWVKELP